MKIEIEVEIMKDDGMWCRGDRIVYSPIGDEVQHCIHGGDFRWKCDHCEGFFNRKSMEQTK